MEAAAAGGKMDPSVAMLVAMMQQQDARHQEQLTHQEARHCEQLAAQQDQLQLLADRLAGAGAGPARRMWKLVIFF